MLYTILLQTIIGHEICVRIIFLNKLRMRFPSYILIGRTFISCLAGTFNYCALSGEWLLCIRYRVRDNKDSLCYRDMLGSRLERRLALGGVR